MNTPSDGTHSQRKVAHESHAYDEDTVRLTPVAPTPPSERELLAGVTGYTQIQPIARGSSALVYKAVQTNLKRDVAIKLLFIDEQLTTAENVAFELETLVRLSQHPHIVTVIDTGVTEHEQPFIVMEYCDGGSYEKILTNSGPLSIESVLEVGIKIGEALAAAHEVGVVHRDVKPPNLLRTRYGPALSDFGVAYIAEQELDGSFRKITPHHASPEALLQQHQTHKSDIYSLGSTLWNLLAGSPPFDNPGSDAEEFRQRVLTQPVPRIPRSDVPEWLQNVIAMAMAKRPAHRPTSATEFVEILRAHSAPNAASSVAATSGAPAVVSTQPYSTQPYSAQPHSGVPYSTPPLTPTSAQPTHIVHTSAPPAQISSSPAPAALSAPAPLSPSWAEYSNPEMQNTSDDDDDEDDDEEDDDEEDDDEEETSTSKGSKVRRALFVAGIAGSVLGVITAITMFMSNGTEPSDDSNDTAEPRKSSEIVTSSRPTNVALEDRGDNVLISWNDTSGGKTPFVIYAALNNGAAQLHTSVDAGETSVTLHGLRSDGEYCFTVAALITDRFGNTNQAPAPAACTTRT